MIEKSYVGLMQEQCVICLAIEDTGVLLNRRLRNTLPHKTVVGFLKDHCKACQSKLENGKRIALVAIDPEKSKEAEIIKTMAMPDGGVGPVVTGYKPESVFRTGDIAFLTREAWEKIFDIPPPAKDMVFFEQLVFDRLAGHPMAEEVDGDEIYQGAVSAERDPQDAEPKELPSPNPGRDISTEDD